MAKYYMDIIYSAAPDLHGVCLVTGTATTEQALFPSVSIQGSLRYPPILCRNRVLGQCARPP